jgi:ABC-2 type transport system ATP-binding protein
MSENNNLIISKNLSKKYNEHLVVDNLNLSVKKGEIFGLLGPNGAGKSTIILMILGLTEPTSGSISIAGFNSTREPLRVKKITGYLPERVGFYDDMTTMGNLAYTAELNNIPYRKIPEKIDEVLEIVGLSNEKTHLVKTFSKGMRQRLGIADVLIKDPELIIFDEPTEGLDVKVANQILQTILDLNKQKNITFLLSSHQLNLVQKICPRVGILSKGKLISEGSVESLGRSMFGGGKYRIELELEKVSREIIEKLKRLDKVVNVTHDGNQLQVTCDSDIRQDISKLITGEGMLLTRIDMKQDALEEIYLKYFKEE